MEIGTYKIDDETAVGVASGRSVEVGLTGGRPGLAKCGRQTACIRV